MNRFIAQIVCFGTFSLVLTGCSPGTKIVTVPVTGKVMFKKTTPAAGALVVFHPVEEAFEKRIGGKPFATVREDGTFTLTTKEQDDGAPEGVYNVTIDWRKQPKTKLSLGSEGGGGGATQIDLKYGNPKAPIYIFTVKAGEGNDFTIDVD